MSKSIIVTHDMAALKQKYTAADDDQGLAYDSQCRGRDWERRMTRQMCMTCTALQHCSDACADWGLQMFGPG